MIDQEILRKSEFIKGGKEMIWIGALIVFLTFWAIIKKYEPRMSLFLAGLIMCIISGKYLLAFDTFSKILANESLVPVLATAMGFAFVMNYTECDKHFSYFALKYVVNYKSLLIPGCVIVVWIFNLAITSAGGLAAAVGPVIIPVMIRAGVHPPLAAAAFIVGTWGSVMSVGSPHIAIVSKISGVDIASLIIQDIPAAIIGLVACCAVISLTAKLMKENTGYESNNDEGEIGISELKLFKVNYLKVILPLLPVIIILLGSKQINFLPLFTIPQAMLICTLLAWVIIRPNPAEMTKRFYTGMGESFGFIISLIAAAAVFTEGMKVIGLTGALIETMKVSSNLAKLVSTFGPLIIAGLSGSADATVLAFNNTITPHAAEFGMMPEKLGMMAFLSGLLGRALSPVAGATLIIAGIARVNPISISKRVLPSAVTVTIIWMLMLL